MRRSSSLGGCAPEPHSLDDELYKSKGWVVAGACLEKLFDLRGHIRWSFDAVHDDAVWRRPKLGKLRETVTPFLWQRKDPAKANLQETSRKLRYGKMVVDDTRLHPWIEEVHPC